MADEAVHFGESGTAFPPTMDDLMVVQKALLDLHNWVVGVRGGWIAADDDERFEVDRRQFGRADAILRDWMRATDIGSIVPATQDEVDNEDET